MTLFLHFFSEKFGQFRKKQYFCTRSPGNSSPRYDAGDESGFFVCMAQRDGMEIIPNARLADSISTL